MNETQDAIQALTRSISARPPEEPLELIQPNPPILRSSRQSLSRMACRILEQLHFPDHGECDPREPIQVIIQEHDVSVTTAQNGASYPEKLQPAPWLRSPKGLRWIMFIRPGAWVTVALTLTALLAILGLGTFLTWVASWLSP